MLLWEIGAINKIKLFVVFLGKECDYIKKVYEF